MEIRRCYMADIDHVIDAVSRVKAEEDDNEVSIEAIKRFLNKDNNYFIVAIDNDYAIGYTIAYQQNRVDTLNDMMCLYEIGVLKKYRRQGVGRLLINELKHICLREKIIKMWVPTNINNVSACTLYERTGGIAYELHDEVIYTYQF